MSAASAKGAGIVDDVDGLKSLLERASSRREFLLGMGGLAVTGQLSMRGVRDGASSLLGPDRPRRGGNFRLAMTGGGSKDTMNAHYVLSKGDEARLVTAFEPLLEYDDQYMVTRNGLAEEVVQDSPTQWTVRVKPGIEFQNGKTLHADDVIYTLRRIVDPKTGSFGGPGLASIDPRRLQKLDSRTVRIHLRRADSTIGDQLAQYHNGIVPVGYKPYPAPQVGTGPYKLKTFTRGERSVHVRNPHYWRSGQPYFDTVTIIDFSDPTAQVNALLSGQVDAMTDLPFAQVPVARHHGGIGILVSRTGGWVPICMAVDLEPFTDYRVRQAFRWIVDRPQIVQQVLSGYGVVANDLYSPFDPDYSRGLPQRHQDLDRARSLLKGAGKDGLTVELHTTNGAAGMVDLATVFAEQAKGAGVTVNVRVDPNYYGNQYLKLPFSVDFWLTHNYLPQTASGMLPKSPFNETHWPPKAGPGSNYASLYQQALAATDREKRGEIIHEMQKLEFNYGGYIIPFFNNLVDAYSTKVRGFKPSKAVLNLNGFGHGFRSIWFA
jgi:peptide/nickel transport system substrate-binding protein